MKSIDIDTGGRKFDAVVGNPPYNQDKSKDGFNGLSLWPYFIESGLQILNDGGYLCFITPGTWMRPSTDIKRSKENGGSKYVFNDFMKNYNTIFIDLGTAKSKFKVGSSFTWYLIENSKYQGTTIIRDSNGIEVEVNLDNFDLLPLNGNIAVVKIFEKIQSGGNKFKFKGIRGPGKEDLEYSDKSSDLYQFKYVGSQYNKKNFNEEFGCIMFYSEKKHPDYNKPKVIVNYIGDIHPYVDDGNAGMQYCQVHFLNSINEVKPIESVVKSKLFRFAYRYVRYGMHNEAGILNSFSYPPLTKTYTDQEIYTHFNLTQEEIDYIESTIK